MAEPTRLELADELQKCADPIARMVECSETPAAEELRLVNACDKAAAALRSADADLAAKTLALDEAFKRIERADQEIVRLKESCKDANDEALALRDESAASHYYDQRLAALAKADQEAMRALQKRAEQAEAALAQMRRMRDESDAAIAWLRSRSQSPTLYEAPGDIGGHVKAALARHLNATED